jgi:hypothetical protein
MSNDAYRDCLSGKHGLSTPRLGYTVAALGLRLTSGATDVQLPDAIRKVMELNKETKP